MMAMRPRALSSSLLVCASLSLIVFGCGGGGGGSERKVQAITLSPATARLVPGGIQSFTAVIDGGARPVTWSVVTSNGGTVDRSGRYTAPNVSGTYTVRAALEGDASKSGTATVVVDSGIAVSVTGAATVAAGASSTYAATVTGASDARVTWSASAGTITPAGVFTAPRAAGPVTITATSVADAGKSKAFAVAIAGPIAVTAPAAGSVAIPGSRLTFTAQLDGVTSTNVTWSASAGTIDANGRWIAPSAPGLATITAKRKDNPAQSASVPAETVADADVAMTVEGRGEIVFDFETAVAPRTTANIVSLVNESYFDGIIIHRYEPDFVVQWGDPQTKTLPLDDSRIGSGGPGYTIPYEPNPLKNVRYSLAMASTSRKGPLGSQMYINLKDNPTLDGDYDVFGAVRTGQSVADALRRGDKILTMRVRKR